jgi:hypothetical protein
LQQCLHAGRPGAVKINDLRETNLIRMTVTAAAPAHAIRCPRCALALEAAAFGGGATIECPACRSELTATFFPAFENPPPAISTASGERALDGEATCFFHPEKRASLACEGCGRFLCALCDMPLGARHLCPACLGSGRRAELVSHRVCWSRVTLLTGLLPVFLGWIVWPFLIFTGLATIFIGLWTWKKPGSLVRGPRHWAAVLGLVGGLVQVGIFSGAMYLIIRVMRHA